MKHLFLNTNVLIDFLADRQPFAEAASDLFRHAHAGRARLYVASLSFSNAFYLLRRTLAATGSVEASPFAQQMLLKIKPLLVVLAVDDAIVTAALAAGFTDFEDALQYHTARSVPAIEALVTRNGKDFARSAMPVLTPQAALAAI